MTPRSLSRQGLHGRVLDVDLEGGLARVRLRRPPLNLIDRALIDALESVFAKLSRDAGVRVAVVSAAGRGFSAGMDVGALRDLDPASARDLITRLRDALRAVNEATFPVIAAVHGFCLGAAFELALCCDLRVAEAGTRLGLPEVKVGIPSVIQAAILPALVGPGRAAELLLTGESVDAERALEWGLVNRVAPAGGLEAAAVELARAILACSPRAIRAQKELMVRWRATHLPGAIELGIDAFARAYETDEPRRAMAAFLAGH